MTRRTAFEFCGYVVYNSPGSLGLMCLETYVQNVDQFRSTKKRGEEIDTVQHRNQQKSQQKEIKVLERGDIYFVYRPKVEGQSVERLEDVQRLYMILSPHGKKRYRLIILGQKKLPEIGDSGQKYWGFVEKVNRKAKKVEDELEQKTYRTKPRGERIQPRSSMTSGWRGRVILPSRFSKGNGSRLSNII